MNVETDLSAALYLWLALALVLLPVQLFITAPYGRHSSVDWGPMLSNRLAWFCMEIVALAGFWVALLLSVESVSIVAGLATFLWSLHYLNRAIIYPLRLRTPGKQMPLVIMVFALVFNIVNSLVNGAMVGAGHLQGGSASVEDLRTLIGVTLFGMGWFINIRSDNTLLALRKQGHSADSSDQKGRYGVPRGGLFEHVSCPNFLGEILAWIGFAVLCWNLSALAFAVWTLCNLLPRALAHHRWYLANLVDYPANRKALIPYLL